MYLLYFVPFVVIYLFAQYFSKRLDPGTGFMGRAVKLPAMARRLLFPLSKKSEFFVSHIVFSGEALLSMMVMAVTGIVLSHASGPYAKGLFAAVGSLCFDFILGNSMLIILIVAVVTGQLVFRDDPKVFMINFAVAILISVCFSFFMYETVQGAVPFITGM